MCLEESVEFAVLADNERPQQRSVHEFCRPVQASLLLTVKRWPQT